MIYFTVGFTLYPVEHFTVVRLVPQHYSESDAMIDFFRYKLGAFLWKLSQKADLIYTRK